MTADIEAKVKARLRQAVLASRRDPAEFCRWVGRQEGNLPIQVGDVHREWHDLLNQYDRLVLWAPVGHGKSSVVTRWRTQWEVGHDPNLRVAIISVSKGGVPAKFMKGIRADIERNPWVRATFPRLRRQKIGQRMWTDQGLIVERDLDNTDPTIQTFGLYGKILGSRLDLIILDDLLNMENTMSEYSREKAWEWVAGEVLSRLPPRGGRVWAIGTPWHREDVLHRLSRIEGYRSVTYSAFTTGPDGQERPTMPELWTLDGLRRREMELQRLAPNLLRCVIPEYENARIKQAWIDRCLMRGRGLSAPAEWNERNHWGIGSWRPGDSPTFTGVDMSHTNVGTGDLACAFTMTILPDGTRRPIDVRSGRWTGPEILDQLIDVHRRYGSIIKVESNGGQQFLEQFAGQLTTLPIKGHTTGLNKHDMRFGVDSIGTEFEQSRWMIPCDQTGTPPAEIAAWLQECRAYSPKDHTGDRLIASWIAREAARESGYGLESWSYAQDRDLLQADLLVR